MDTETAPIRERPVRGVAPARPPAPERSASPRTPSGQLAIPAKPAAVTGANAAAVTASAVAVSGPPGWAAAAAVGAVAAGVIVYRRVRRRSPSRSGFSRSAGLFGGRRRPLFGASPFGGGRTSRSTRARGGSPFGPGSPRSSANRPSPRSRPGTPGSGGRGRPGQTWRTRAGRLASALAARFGRWTARLLWRLLRALARALWHGLCFIVRQAVGKEAAGETRNTRPTVDRGDNPPPAVATPARPTVEGVPMPNTTPEPIGPVYQAARAFERVSAEYKIEGTMELRTEAYELPHTLNAIAAGIQHRVSYYATEAVVAEYSAAVKSLAEAVQSVANQAKNLGEQFDALHRERVDRILRPMPNEQRWDTTNNPR